MLIVASCIGGLLAPTPGHAQSQLGTQHESSDGLPYLLTPPASDARPGETPPLLLFLHGGDRSNTRHHPARYAAGEGIDDFPFLVVAPHCTAGCAWTRVDFEALLADVRRIYAFDESRVYLTGYSMGGYGAWSALARFPDLFAAAAPIAGGGDAAAICAAKAVPIRAYHGDQDTVIPHSSSVEMVEALAACGGNAQLTTLAGVDHGSWVPTFKDEAFYGWLLGHSR